MDTWATSSISPQINARAISANVQEPSPSGRGLGEGSRVKNSPWSPEFLSRVRQLRHNTTDAEQYMWSILRDRQMEGFKFRRQHPIAPYVVDFFSHEAGLIIELDGGQHNEHGAHAKDVARTHFLEGKGYKVLRFWNNDVLEDMEGVFDVISQTLAAVVPHPNPLPGGEGSGRHDAVNAQRRVSSLTSPRSE
jgi:very-short-patch-repair endonuclease